MIIFALLSKRRKKKKTDYTDYIDFYYIEFYPVAFSIMSLTNKIQSLTHYISDDVILNFVTFPETVYIYMYI